MRKFLAVTATAALILSAASEAQAQFGRRPSGNGGGPPPNFDCNQLAAMPNAPMSVQACQQMMNSARSIQNSVNDPSAARPGDEAMTCDQIKAEFLANGGMPLNRGHVAEAGAAAKDMQAKQAQVQKEGMELAAREQASQAAVSAAGFVPVYGKAAQAAQDAKNAAEQKAFGEHAQQVLNPATQRTVGATNNVIGDVATDLQSNPRQGRLIALANQKKCK